MTENQNKAIKAIREAKRSNSLWALLMAIVCTRPSLVIEAWEKMNGCHVVQAGIDLSSEQDTTVTAMIDCERQNNGIVNGSFISLLHGEENSEAIYEGKFFRTTKRFLTIGNTGNGPVLLESEDGEKNWEECEKRPF